jgi:hypothetical protein
MDAQDLDFAPLNAGEDLSIDLLGDTILELYPPKSQIEDGAEQLLP